MTDSDTPSSAPLAVSARGLVKNFGDNRAVDGIDLEVRRGEIFGVLGPNGAGKTTMLSMLATLLKIDGGEAEIFGLDVRSQAHEVRQLLGVTGQYASVDENLTGYENLWLFARLLGLSRAEARERATSLLAQFGLEDAADRPISKFSGGMRRRLDLAVSLITRPPLIFLDEPTTGLDPRTRGQMWTTIRSLVADGCTVLLTTQYLDEADQLADRIAVIDRGVKVAEGTPDQLKSSIGSSTLHLRIADPAYLQEAADHPGPGAARRARAHPRGRRHQRAPQRRRPGCRGVDRAAAGRDQRRLRQRRQAHPRRGVPGPDRTRHQRGRGSLRPHRRQPGTRGRAMTTLSTFEGFVADPAAEVTHRVSPADTVSQTMTMAWRATKKMRRNPEQFFDVVFQPLLFTAMFAYIFGGAVSGSVQDYLPLLIPGILAQTTLTACIATGIQLREDMDKGVFDRFKSLPIARIAPLAGPMVADLLRYTIATVLTFATGFVMGYRPDGGVFGVVSATLLVIVTGWSLAWIFTFVGIIGRSAQSVQGISMMIMFPLTFLSNAFVPEDTLPTWLQKFVQINPVSHVVSAVRDLANTGTVTAQVGWALVACIAVVAVFAPLSVRAYRRAM